jgi:3-methyladenine DNA glycosylase AlkD
MTAKEILAELKSYGDERTKSTLMKHGAKEPFFGVKVADLKKILKKTKKNHELSLELYASGNSDAMYLAGLMADETKITKAQLNDWIDQAYWYYISEYAVPWVAAETPFGFELGMEWVKSKKPHIVGAGYATLASHAGVNADENLDIAAYSKLLDYIGDNIHQAENRVRHVMNHFVISIGSFIKPLTEKAQKTAMKIGKVSVNMGGTACKVPLATDYIQKVIDRGSVGKKRKSARC